MKNEDWITIEHIPTIKELVESTGMTQKAFAEHFDIPIRTIQNWIGGQRQCPEYVRNMIEKILENEKFEVVFTENTKKCLEQMVPCARSMYSEIDFDIRTPEDIVKYALAIVMEEIAREYGEYVIDDKYGTVDKIYFPSRENPLYELDR